MWAAVLLIVYSAVSIQATTDVNSKLQFKTQYLADGTNVTHEPALIALQGSHDGQFLKVVINSLLLDDQPAPLIPKGATTYDIMSDAENTEMYFSNEEGHRFILVLNPFENYYAATWETYPERFPLPLEEFLPMNVTTHISSDRRSWYAEALVPTRYLPRNFTLFNAYYQHGSAGNREMGYINTDGAQYLELEFAEIIVSDDLIAGFSDFPMSSTWKNVLEKPLTYEIRRYSNGTLLRKCANGTVLCTASSIFVIDTDHTGTLDIKIKSPFYNDPPPNVPDGTRTPVIQNYEAAEIIFLNPSEQYLRVIVGPRGHYFAEIYSEYERFKTRRSNILLNVTAGVGRDRKSWYAVVNIPVEYIPMRANYFNAFASHGMDEGRIHEAYHPTLPILSEERKPFSEYSAIDLEKVLPNFSKRAQSKEWEDILERPLKFKILTTFDNKPLDHEAHEVTLDVGQFGNLNVSFNGKFFDSPRPTAPDGSSVNGLWIHERMEVYFANDRNEYFQLQIGPYGHYFGMMFSDSRVQIRNNIPLEVTVSLDKESGRWHASALVPLDFLPANITKWNAYYAYGQRGSLTFQAYGPSFAIIPDINFHDLSLFQEINLDLVIPELSVREPSTYWKGPFSYAIFNYWNTDQVDHTPVTFNIDSKDDKNLQISIKSIFWNDPPPPPLSNWNFVGIWQYEVAEIFFANDLNEYLQLEFAPFGHFQAMLLAGERNYKRYNLPLNIMTKVNPTNKGFWEGNVTIPLEYLPANVTKMNAYYSHGPHTNRVYEALEPARTRDQLPDFHNLEIFRPVDLDILVANLSIRPQSDLWRDALEGKGTYEIKHQWNGALRADQEAIEITLSGTSDELLLDVDSPLFLAPAPNAPTGEPFNSLVDYEAVRVFFMNDIHQYLEVQVGPYGHHLVMLWWTKNGAYNQMRHSLPLNVTTNIHNGRWTGRVAIPAEYFPPQVTLFNAHANHRTESGEQEMALFPQFDTDAAADPHAIKYFQAIDFNTFVANQSETQMSQIWQDTILGIYRYKIRTEWNSVPVNHEPTVITLEGFEGGVELNATASFFNDPAPDGEPGKPFYGLWDYEVVEMFFLNDNDEYLEVELGPWGQHILLMLKGERNTIKHSLPLDYVVTARVNGTNGEPGIWQGSALIPPEYFPPNVTKMNAYGIHGVGDNRVYEALYPAPENDPNYPQPDFHRLELFKTIDFEYLVVDNSQYSQLWLDAISAADTTTPASASEKLSVDSIGNDGAQLETVFKAETEGEVIESVVDGALEGAIESVAVIDESEGTVGIIDGKADTLSIAADVEPQDVELAIEGDNFNIEGSPVIPADEQAPSVLAPVPDRTRADITEPELVVDIVEEELSRPEIVSFPDEVNLAVEVEETAIAVEPDTFVSETDSTGIVPESEKNEADQIQSEPFVVVFKKPVVGTSKLKTGIHVLSDDTDISDTFTTEVEQAVTEQDETVPATEIITIIGEDDSIVTEVYLEEEVPEEVTTTIPAGEGSAIADEFIRIGGDEVTENPEIETTVVEKIPKPTLVKEARLQEFSNPAENLFRPLVVRPHLNRPIPSKILNNENLKAINRPQFFSSPHFPPPTVFTPHHPQLFPQNSPYNNGFQFPSQINPISSSQQIPQPHRHHLFDHHQRDRNRENLEPQQVVDKLPSVNIRGNDFKVVSKPLPLPIHEEETELAKPIQPLTIQEPVEERRLTDDESILIPEQTLQAVEQPEKPTPNIISPTVPTQTVIPSSAIPTNFPPPHNICFYQGLHPDPNRCPIFHECTMDGSEWKVYTWRCPRGKYFDPKTQNCISGFC